MLYGRKTRAVNPAVDHIVVFPDFGSALPAIQVKAK